MECKQIEGQERRKSDAERKTCRLDVPMTKTQHDHVRKMGGSAYIRSVLDAAIDPASVVGSHAQLVEKIRTLNDELKEFRAVASLRKLRDETRYKAIFENDQEARKLLGMTTDEVKS